MANKMEYTYYIELNDLHLEVTGIYTEGEPEVRYHSDMSGTPASGSEFEIKAVLLAGWDIMEIMTEERLEEIETIMINRIER